LLRSVSVVVGLVLASPLPGQSCFEAHEGVGCDDPVCEAAVCAIDPFCCDTVWDSFCAFEAADLCIDCDAAANVALGKPICVSSQQSAPFPFKADTIGRLNDGNTGAPHFATLSKGLPISRRDNQWIVIDLGECHVICEVTVWWEYAAAAEYCVQVSVDNCNWTTVAEFTGGTLGARSDVLDAVASGIRYVRLLLKDRASSASSNLGYGIYEIEVKGEAQGGGCEPPENLADAADGTTAEASSSMNPSECQFPQFCGPVANILDCDPATGHETRHEFVTVDPNLSPEDELIIVTLPGIVSIDKVELNWQRAFALRYRLQYRQSTGDGWTTLATVTDGDGSYDVHQFDPVCALQLRLRLGQRSTLYTDRDGYSLVTFKAFGPGLCI
jgi:hypothetical protein